MGNLYRLNSLFELEISRFPKELDIDKTLLERNAAFEYLFLLLSQREDYTILSESPSEELLEYWEKNKITFGKTIQTDTPYFARELKLNRKIAEDTNLIEWGKSCVLNQKENTLQKKYHTISFSNFLNSKINQTRWKDSQKVNKLTSVICLNKVELDYALDSLNLPLVIKTEFGFSGRGHIILKTKVEIKDFSKKMEETFRLNSKGVIVEEWVEENKILDFSGIFDLSLRKSGLVAITRMLIGKNGVYQGSVIEKDFGKEFEEDIITIMYKYARTSSSYKGSVSLDGFTFHKEDKIEVQYMSEINFRYSMGRVLYELHKKIGEVNEEYALLFFPVKNKNITFKSLVSDLSKLKTEHKSEILIVTPLANSEAKKNPFLGFYVSNKKAFPKTIMDAIKKLLL